MTMDTNTDPREPYELFPCQYLRGHMALVWKGGTLYQVFSGPIKSEVRQDAEAYTYMMKRGLL